jgi:hypothetical protein
MIEILGYFEFQRLLLFFACLLWGVKFEKSYLEC